MPYTKSEDLLVEFRGTAQSSARGAKVVVPSDTGDLSPYAKALKCNVEGTVMLLAVEDYERGVLTPVPYVVTAGEIIPIQVARVFETATSVTSIVALYK